MPWSARQSVEAFHLHFLRQLCVGADRAHFRLKGDCNLRFFFGSLRYSEDMDLDVVVTAKETLRNKVDRILASPALLLPLKNAGLVPTDVSSPKQTEPTQRWKLGLVVAGHSAPLRTKIEFSRREAAEGGTAVDALPAALTREYGIPPAVVAHYDARTALIQKLEALVGRPQTQARDVFDLQLLRSKAEPLPAVGSALHAQRDQAVECVMSLSHADYLAQVVAYLEPEQQPALRDREVWDAMQAEVVALIEGLSP